MEPERWEQIQSIFAVAAELPAEEKPGAVRAMCGGDDGLAESVLALLAEDTRPQALLDGDVSEVVSRMASATLRSDHLRSLVERQIGPYHLLRVLGEGGMGIVYLAERSDIGGQVAIKLLRDSWLSPMRRERFAMEQLLLVKLNHHAIARIYDASTMEDGTPWFVMEFADGRPLTEYLRERGASVRDDLMLFQQVCEAVQYAHSHAIIHRDLKPSNILVTAEGAVKLLDFGIAKRMDEVEDRERTVAGLRLLTPGYAAPEQCNGGDIGVFTDVYSLGVLLYEILTGQLPKLDEARSGKPPERPSTVARRTGLLASRSRLSRQEWAELDVLCLTAMQPEPARRYRSVDALDRDLAAYLTGRALEARPNSFFYTAERYVRRNFLPLLSVSVLVLLLAGAALLFTIRLARARNAALAEAARTERIQHFMLDMLGSSDEEAGPSSELKVVTLLDREAQHTETLRSDPRTQVELYQTIGSMYNRLGEYPKSEQLLVRALALSKRTGGAASAEVAAIEVQLGVLLGDRGETDKAKADLVDALDMARAQHLAAKDPTITQAKIALGRIYIQGAAYQKAIDELSPIAASQTGPGGISPYDLRDSVSSLAVAELAAQHYDRSEALSRRAIQLDKEILGESHPQTGVDMINLASTEVSQGEFATAEPLYRTGIGIMSAWYGPDNPDVVTSKSILAQTLIEEKRDAEAEEILAQVLPVQEKDYGKVHTRVALTLISLGELASRRGDMKAAEGYTSRALDIYEALSGKGDVHTAAARSNLGVIYLKEGRDAMAEAALRGAVAVISLLPPGNNLIGVARGRWGRALLRLKRYPEAEQQLTEADALTKAQHNPPAVEVANIRSDLVALALATNQPH